MIKKRSKKSIYHTQRIKEYPAAGMWECLTADRPIFREPGWERPDGGYRPITQNSNTERSAENGDQAASSPESIARAVRRARVALRDYALCTDFSYFVTLTLDPSKVDRFDMREITRKMQAWCSNNVQRHGLAYVLVPELHKDGAVHFHGFFNDALPVVDSGTIVRAEGGKPRKPRSKAERAAWLAAGGRIVYNLPAWTLGFTTAMELWGEYPKAVAYVCKYIGKQQGGEVAQKIGGRWYYSGGQLGRPIIHYADGDWREAMEGDTAYGFQIEAARAFFVKEHGNY